MKKELIATIIEEVRNILNSHSDEIRETFGGFGDGGIVILTNLIVIFVKDLSEDKDFTKNMDNALCFIRACTEYNTKSIKDKLEDAKKLS